MDKQQVVQIITNLARRFTGTGYSHNSSKSISKSDWGHGASVNGFDYVPQPPNDAGDGFEDDTSDEGSPLPRSAIVGSNNGRQREQLLKIAEGIDAERDKKVRRARRFSAKKKLDVSDV
jgi:hypothetical protein